MDALKRFSLALMAAVVVAGATPAFSQTRDTRPTGPDRPRTDQGDGGSGGGTAEADRDYVPKSSPGLSCVIDYEPGYHYVYLTNNTGETIPAGTVVTWYAQPGGAQGSYVTPKDWPPGGRFNVPVGDKPAIAEISFCTVKFSTARQADPPAEEPERADKPVTDNPFEKGDIRILTRTERLKLPHRAVTVECEMVLMGDGIWYAHVTYNGAPGQVYWPMKMTVNIQPTGATHVAQVWDDWGAGFDFTYGDATAPAGEYDTPPTCTASIY